jgi:hypothetical protein
MIAYIFLTSSEKDVSAKRTCFTGDFTSFTSLFDPYTCRRAHARAHARLRPAGEDEKDVRDVEVVARYLEAA